MGAGTRQFRLQCSYIHVSTCNTPHSSAQDRDQCQCGAGRGIRLMEKHKMVRFFILTVLSLLWNLRLSSFLHACMFTYIIAEVEVFS